MKISKTVQIVGTQPGDEPVDVPTSFQVFPYGKIELAGEQPFVVDEEAMNDVTKRFEERRLDMVIDYEHQTEGGEFSSPDGVAPAAGWIKGLSSRSTEGLWVEVEWTERARNFLANREYRYFSPVFLLDKKSRRLVELLRVALTNAPRLNAIQPIVSKNTNNEGASMDFIKKLASLLGLPDDSDEEKITSALSAVLEQRDGVMVEIAKALDLPETSGKSEIIGTLHAIKRTPDLAREVATLKQKLSQRESDDLIEQAIKARKITGGMLEWARDLAAKDPEALKVFIAKAPPVVPEDLPADPNPKSASPKADVMQQEVNRQMGLTEEVWAKYN